MIWKLSFELRSILGDFWFISIWSDVGIHVKFWNYSIFKSILMPCRSMWGVTWWTDKNTYDLKAIFSIRIDLRWFLVHICMVRCGEHVKFRSYSIFKCILMPCRSIWDFTWWTDKNTYHLKAIFWNKINFRWFLVHICMVRCRHTCKISKLLHFQVYFNAMQVHVGCHMVNR